MKFYCLHEGYYQGIQERIDLLNKACKLSGIKFNSIDSLTCDYSNLPRLNRGDILYNVGRGSETLESLLINKSTTTFYIENPKYISYNSDTIKYSMVHEKNGLPAPKTIFSISPDRRNLEKYIKYLGGFPIILKSIGSTRGIGTIKIESWQSLISIIDYLFSDRQTSFIMREFIPNAKGCRMIVLGDKVIASAEFKMNKNDFRNAVIESEVEYYKRKYTKNLEEIAVKASHLANTSFSGVDFLEDELGNFYLLEINFPCGFQNLIQTCSIDIPDEMVKFLIKKSENDL